MVKYHVRRVKPKSGNGNVLATTTDLVGPVTAWFGRSGWLLRLDKLVWQGRLRCFALNSQAGQTVQAAAPQLDKPEPTGTEDFATRLGAAGRRWVRAGCEWVPLGQAGCGWVPRGALVRLGPLPSSSNDLIVTQSIIRALG